jgi:hypothetical protein
METFIEKTKEKAWNASRYYSSMLRLGLEYRSRKRTFNNYSAKDYQNVIQRSIAFIETTRVGDHPGRFGYVPGGPALLYSSCYAALSFSLLGIVDDLSPSQKGAWIDEILSYQQPDGLFTDPLIDCGLASTLEWWGWKHLTLHAMMALAVLGGQPKRFPEYLFRFKRSNTFSAWLSSQAWEKEPANISNAIQNVGTFFQFAQYYGMEPWMVNVQDEMFDWLDANQDPQTGSWGKFDKSKESRSQCVQTGYHIWLLYFWVNRPLKYCDSIIDTCLQTQNEVGGFGPVWNSSACEDIDTIDPLSRLIGSADPSRKLKISNTLTTALPWVLFQQNNDGGWVFKRRTTFEYGHPLMRQEYDASTMFPTWFRLLSLAYIAKAIPDHPIASIRWDLSSIPGHQFWI